MKMAKYVFVTGGVVSGLGKGICAASLGRLLKQRGLIIHPIMGMRILSWGCSMNASTRTIPMITSR